MKNLKIAIIGGGLTGCCVAASLSDIAKRITLFESGPQLLGEASSYNEGRIHLGYTYGMDKSLNTARLMARAALSFENLLNRWFGEKISKIPRSSCFNYAVHKKGLLSGTEYGAFAKKVSEIIKQTLKRGDKYFGIDLKKPPSKLSSKYVSAHYDINNISSVFETSEISVDPEAIAEIIRKNIVKIPGVKIRCNTEVLATKIQNSRYILQLLTPDNHQIDEPFDCVINASGRSLLRLDSLIGIQPPKNPLFRLKYLIRTRTKDIDVTSTTVVLGKFGDTVNFNDFMFLSWYPAGRLDWYEGLNPQKANPILTKQPQASRLKKEIIMGLSTIIPRLKSKQINNSDLRGNWIYAPATSDVNNPTSALHQRTQVGIIQSGNYFSINPGKYTSAPYFANNLAKKIKYA